MRVVSMVPSWTETLLRAGINVVGRTRFCIHPANRVSNIAIVGGTKEVSWDLVMDLKPDIVLLDQEENPYEMAEECPVKYVATHVHSIETLQKELVRLGEFFENAALMELAVDALDVLEKPTPKFDPKKIPGFMEWVKIPSQNYEEVLYLIWKKPWMAVSKETYIGSVLNKLGMKVVEFPEGEKYPVIELEDHPNALCLFSSEPFPFAKKISDLKGLGVEGAIVNGESFSWFGHRSIQFLKETLK
ncbi:helical backbone metal receptor [Bdellovibrio sp. SKB1291214]|uniref:helical backbone metal receptor n=1 Tax=Bdellovibrio sp. SKB1291214 TaxID=1732569 RepID=UPI0020CCC977|nr:helical backbone metal receptor [Bdellovibrio sp. SKB1291214]UYL07676.1 helical backbone metal receptor [Bdellovibrio sp. SKB1291214]